MIHHDPADEPPADPIRRGVENRIVVGVDGSETSKRALAWSVDEASAWRAQVIAVHVWMPPYVEAELVPPAAWTAEYERLGSETLDSAIDAVDTSRLATPVDRLVVSGAPPSALLAAAEGADLLVVGSRGAGGFRDCCSDRSATMWPTTRCPVVVIPHTH